MKHLAISCLLCISFATLSTSANAKGLIKFDSQVAKCTYLEDKKEAAEDRLRRDYRESQYSKLEAKRKYWINMYVDTCFEFNAP